MRVWPLIVIALGLSTQAGESPGALRQAGCAGDGREVGDDDLYCIELLPAADIERASGTARLVPPSSPFGAAVTAAGEPQHDVILTLRDLPSPGSLGRFTVLVAWAATPQLRPVVKLGEVRDGTTRLGRIGFDRFLVLISAEPSLKSTEPTGRMVLRGSSASVRMQPHDLAFLLAGLLDRKDSAAAGPRPARRARCGCGAGRLDSAADAPSRHDAACLHDVAARRLILPAGRGSRDSACAATRAGRPRRSGDADARSGPGSPRALRADRDHARLQRPVPRAAHPGAGGLDDRRALREPDGFSYRHPLARAAPRQPL